MRLSIFNYKYIKNNRIHHECSRWILKSTYGVSVSGMLP